jgi:hypothetical protein
MPRHQRTGPTIAKSSRSEKPPVTATPNPGYFRHLEINGYQYYARPQQKSVAKPTNAKPAHVCRIDPSRMFDCLCGTNDSYCLVCEEPMSCVYCAMREE